MCRKAKGLEQVRAAPDGVTNGPGLPRTEELYGPWA